MDLLELVRDGDEIVRIIRRDRAYWTLWGMRGPRAKRLPEHIADLTGETRAEVEGRTYSHTAPPDDAKIAEVRARGQAIRERRRRDREGGKGRKVTKTDLRKRRDEAFGAEFHTLRQRMEGGEHGEGR
jgi:hypothetical protein